MGSVKGLLAVHSASLLGRPSLLPVERPGDRSGSIAARAHRLLIHLRTEARDKVSNSSLKSEAGAIVPESPPAHTSADSTL